MPTSPDELIAQCETIEAAGYQCFAHDWFEFGVGARLFLALVQQQGGTLTDDCWDGDPRLRRGARRWRSSTSSPSTRTRSRATPTPKPPS